MKKVLFKTLVMLVGLLLVVPFVASGMLVGARAVVGAEGPDHQLLLVSLAFAGALFSGIRNFDRPTRVTREGNAQGVRAEHVEVPGHTFLKTRTF